MKQKLLLITAAFITIMFQAMTMNAQQPGQKTRNNNSSRTKTDITTYSGITTMDFSEDGHRYRVKLDGTKITEMYVDDKKVAEEDYAKYDSMVKKIITQMEKDRAQAEKDRQQAEKDREQAEVDRQRANKDREHADKDRQQADVDRKQAAEERVQAEKHRRQADEERGQVEKDRTEAEKDRKRADKDRLAADEDRKQADIDRQHADKDRQQAEKDRVQADKDRQQADIDRKLAEEDRKRMDEMIDELIKEKLVANRSELKSLILDDKQFIVNDVKQSDSIHSKYKAKYLKNSDSRININTGSYRRVN